MWEDYRDIIRRYPKLPLCEERRLISKAQKGSRLRQACLPARQGFGGQARKSKDEILLRHSSFLIFRIHKIAFPTLIQRFGLNRLNRDSDYLFFRTLNTLIYLQPSFFHRQTFP